jgi:hypothetical protein
LAELAREASSAPATTERVATLVRARPWRGVGIALGLGFALGLSRGRGVRAVAAVAGPLGAALATGFLRQVALGASSPRSALDAKIAEVRSRSAER